MSAAYPPALKYVKIDVKGNYAIITLNRSERQRNKRGSDVGSPAERTVATVRIIY